PTAQRRPAPKPPAAGGSNGRTNVQAAASVAEARVRPRERQTSAATEGGSNRMSLSSDTEGPPPGPLHPSLSRRTNPDIREEDGEGDPTPSAPVQNHPSSDNRVDNEPTKPKREAAAGLDYDQVKYTLVVDEHAQLELVKLKDCLHGHTEHNEDSDAETVYQSANEEEDPEYEEERRKSEEARKLGKRRGAGNICPDSVSARRFVPRHADELQLETDDPVLMLKQSEDLWCQGYNMRTGATGIFPAFYAVRMPKDGSHGTETVRNDGWTEPFVVRFLGSVQVPVHMGNDVLCAAMQKVACNRRSAGQPPSACVLEVSVKGVKMIVQDQCHSGDQCFHFFHLKNISFCGCHPKHSRYFGFITKHPDQQRFACHVLMSDATLHPLAESVRRAFQQYYKEHIGYSCPTEDIFIE
uniref:Mitogen-activated protein kinase 8 interacting protein 1a n=1 Tax=Fundulus heteroclitus TaxID=8078 RepID=A0A3Q2PTI6_FUNHE